MFDSAALRADILADFEEVQAMSCNVEEIWADLRANKWREYQREWVRAKRAKRAKYPPRFCLCCGKALPKQTTGRERRWCGESCRCRARRNRDNRAD